MTNGEHAQPEAPQGAAYAGLPARRRSFFCTKCGGRECEPNTLGQAHPVCKCGYMGFAEDLDYTADQMRDFAGRTHALRASHGQAPAGAWIERWYGSGGKDGYEGWSIVNKEDRGLVAYLGRNVESGAVTEIVMAHNATLATTTAQAAPAGANVRRSDLVPGVMHCAKCKFQLNRVTLCVSDGNAYAGDNKTEPCPNGCGPLWPVTWEQEARNCWKTLEEMHERLQAAPAAGAVARPNDLITIRKPTTRQEVEWLAKLAHLLIGDVNKTLDDLLAAAPTPAAQADSQPAPVAAHVVADALADSQYLAGVSAGWNAANADDPNAALQKLHESRAGYLKPLSAARAPADSVLEDAARLELERICAAIKAEDDYCVEHGDYMLDSDDCIKIVRGEWVRPDFSVDAARKQGAKHDNH